MSVCTCAQNPASQYVEMDLWRLVSSVTVATVTSALTPAAITQMKRRTKGANFSPANCAGQESRFLPLCLELAVDSIELVVDLLSGPSPCSPSQGPCCTEQCTFKGASDRCRLDSECAKEGMCNGGTALCPTSEPKENFTSCNKETQVCLGGVRSKQRCARVALFTLCCFLWA